MWHNLCNKIFIFSIDLVLPFLKVKKIELLFLSGVYIKKRICSSCNRSKWLLSSSIIFTYCESSDHELIWTRSRTNMFKIKDRSISKEISLEMITFDTVWALRQQFNRYLITSHLLGSVVTTLKSICSSLTSSYGVYLTEFRLSNSKV